MLLIFILASLISLISLLGAYQFAGSETWLQEYGKAVFEVQAFDLGSLHFPNLYFEYSSLLAELYLALLIGVLWLATVLIAKKNVLTLWDDKAKRYKVSRILDTSINLLINLI